MKNKGVFLALVGLLLFVTSVALADNETYDSQDRLISRTENGVTYSYAYGNWGEIFETVSEGGTVTERNCYYEWSLVESHEPQGAFTESSSNGVITRTVSQSWSDDDGDYSSSNSYVFNSSGQNISNIYEETGPYGVIATETLSVNTDGTWTGSYTNRGYHAGGSINFVEEGNYQLDQDMNNQSYTSTYSEYYENGTLAYSGERSSYFDANGREVPYSMKELEYNEEGQAVYITQNSTNGINVEGEIVYENGKPVVYSSGGNYNNDFNKECPDGSGWSGCQYTSSYQLDDNFNVAVGQTVVTDQNGNFIWKQEVSENDGVMIFSEYTTEDATIPSVKYAVYSGENGLITENMDPITGNVLSSSVSGQSNNGAYVLTYDENGQLKSIEINGASYSVNSNGKVRGFQNCMACVR